MSLLFEEVLAAAAEGSGIALSDAGLKAFGLYYKELLQWNAKMNLTAITGPEEAAIKHFLDSLLVAKHVPLSGSLVDIGSGAGFPGLPLKIVQPGLQVVLVEAVRKKASFLRQVVRLLRLEGVEVYNGRVEDLDRPAAFDYATSRAFSEFALFCRLAAPLLKPGGVLVAMKGREKNEQPGPFPGFSCAGQHTYELPGRKGGRSLILLQKCFT
jgi:16S rRNA (guanine527-N7)-methyltransferase